MDVRLGGERSVGSGGELLLEADCLEEVEMKEGEGRKWGERRNAVQCNAVHCAPQRNAMHHNAVQCIAPQRNAMQCSTAERSVQRSFPFSIQVSSIYNSSQRKKGNDAKGKKKKRVRRLARSSRKKYPIYIGRRMARDPLHPLLLFFHLSTFASCFYLLPLVHLSLVFCLLRVKEKETDRRTDDKQNKDRGGMGVGMAVKSGVVGDRDTYEGRDVFG